MKYIKRFTFLLCLCCVAFVWHSCIGRTKTVSIITEGGSIKTEHVSDDVYYAKNGSDSVRFELGSAKRYLINLCGRDVVVFDVTKFKRQPYDTISLHDLLFSAT